MCGPLQAVVMGQWLKSKRRANWLTYHAGRLSAYIILGTAAALIGTALGLPQWQNEFTIAAGLILIFGYFLIKALRWDRRLLAIFTPFLQRFRPKGNEEKQGKFYFSSGVLNGFLPCGMVYAALLPAAGLSSIAQAPLYMLSFGLGTLPLLLAFNLFSNSLMLRFGPWFQRLIPVTVVLIGSLLILRGLELGVPFISPEAALSNSGAEGCR